MNARYLLVLPAIAVLVASGCTVPGMGTTLSGGKGIIIEAFEADFPQIYTNENVQLSLKVRNAGTVEGTITDVKLVGVMWEGGLAGGGGCQPSMKTKLLPAVPDKGMTGETRSCTWDVKPDENVPAGLSVTFYPTARVTYKYSTSTVKSITVGTSQELRNLMNAGGALPADTVSTTSGPIAIDVVSKGPIRASGPDVEIPVEIKISNIGGGIACTSCGDSQSWSKIKISVSAPGMEGGGSDSCVGEREVTLWRGKDNTIGCRLKAPGPDQITGRVQKLITVTAKDYEYMIDATTPVTLTGSASGGL